MEQLIKDLCERNRDKSNEQFCFYSFEKKMTLEEVEEYKDDIEDGHQYIEAEPSDHDDFINQLTQQTAEEILSAVREMVDGMRESEVCENPDDCPYCGRNMYCRGHSDEIAHNQALDDLLTKLQANDKNV